MRIRAIILVATIIMAPPGARAADLVVWWEEGNYEQEDAALRETIAAFEQHSGKPVELVFYAGVVTKNITAGQAVDEAIARIKEILSE